MLSRESGDMPPRPDPVLIDCGGKLFRKFKGVPLYQNLLRLSERQDPAPAGSKGLLGQTPSAAGSCC